MGASTTFRRWLVFLALACLLSGAASAQDVQTGHYAPGWNAPLSAGAVPVDPGWYVLNTTMYFSAQRFRDGAGNVSSNEETDYLLTAFAISWRPDVRLLGGDYMAVVTPAFGNLSGLPVLVDGVPQDPGTGLTDLYFAPLVLGWHLERFEVAAAAGGFAPTGSFTPGSADNTGLGFWTFIPHVAATYRLDTGIFEKTPFLAMGALRYEVHSNQEGRDFRPGNTLTFEWGVGVEVGGRTDVGLSGFVYRQASDPTGADARPVDRYRSNGIGAHVSHNFGKVNLGLRVYRDYDVRNGPQGTLAYLEIGFGWPRQSSPTNRRNP
ncbi:MAG: hypothetical protein AMS21_11465 [Gemmatimonas sp. SG8_38_2]|nr:MAG: hypothetical protein AMS21_11465 [Gemmatimonas sp. SG8_38_2]